MDFLCDILSAEHRALVFHADRDVVATFRIAAGDAPESWAEEKMMDRSVDTLFTHKLHVNAVGDAYAEVWAEYDYCARLVHAGVWLDDFFAYLPIDDEPIRIVPRGGLLCRHVAVRYGNLKFGFDVHECCMLSELCMLIESRLALPPRHLRPVLPDRVLAVYPQDEFEVMDTDEMGKCEVPQ